MSDEDDGRVASAFEAPRFDAFANDEPSCAAHAGVLAEGTCARCGSYACSECVAMRHADERFSCRRCVLAHRRPFRPSHIGWISFFFGPPAGAVLHAINARRLGRPGRTALAAVGIWLFFFAFIAVTWSLPDAAMRPLGTIMSALFASYYGRAGKAEVRAYEDAGGKPGSGWRALCIGVGALAALVVVGFAAAFAFTIVQWRRAEAAIERGDYDQAAEIYESECAAGDPVACTSGGWVHEQRGDDASARRWYERGCNDGDAPGCNNAGVLIEQGRGGPADLGRARELYRQACEAGDRHGCENAQALGAGP